MQQGIFLQSSFRLKKTTPWYEQVQQTKRDFISKLKCLPLVTKKPRADRKKENERKRTLAKSRANANRREKNN